MREWFYIPLGESRKIYDMDADDFVEISVAAIAPMGQQFQHSALRLPCCFRMVVFRPFQTYNMSSAILMKSGLETGFTAHGHHDFMLTDDVIHKCHIGHYNVPQIIVNSQRMYTLWKMWRLAMLAARARNLSQGLSNCKREHSEKPWQGCDLSMVTEEPANGPLDLGRF